MGYSIKNQKETLTNSQIANCNDNLITVCCFMELEYFAALCLRLSECLDEVFPKKSIYAICFKVNKQMEGINVPV